MAKNIAISDPAYDRLRKHKREGESFSEVLLRMVPARPSLAEILKEIRARGPVDMTDVEKDVARQRKEYERRAKKFARMLD